MRTVRIEKGRTVGVTSDTHYNHRKIIGYCERPWLFFDTDNRLRKERGEPYEVSDEIVRMHDDYLIDRCNARLGEDAVLIHCGDVAWNGRAKLGEYRDRLRAKAVYVCVGNHDDEDDLVHVFGREFVAERWEVAVDGPGGVRTAVADHYPGHSWQGSHRGTWLLFGHVHGKLDRRHETNPGWLLSQDAGVESHGFGPWLWQEELVPLFDGRRVAWQAWRDREYATPKELGGMAVKGCDIGLPDSRDVEFVYSQFVEKYGETSDPRVLRLWSVYRDGFLAVMSIARTGDEIAALAEAHVAGSLTAAERHAQLSKELCLRILGRETVKG